MYETGLNYTRLVFVNGATMSTEGFISIIFLVPKKDDQWTLILNLKALNAYTEYEHFKMEDIRSVKDVLHYMSTLDLKDVYLSVPMNPAYRKFQWQSRTCHYKINESR